MQETQFPKNLKSNLFEQFLEMIEERMIEDDTTPYDAIARSCMDLYGLTSEDGASRSDGAGDRGIDWYRISKKSADLWQFKGTDDLERASFERSVVVSDLSDLRRMVD